jgi:hypothetical protein
MQQDLQFMRFYYDYSSPNVISQLLTTASVKVAVFWDVTACSLVDRYQSFRGTYCLNLLCGRFHPEDGDSRFHRNAHAYIYQPTRIISQEAIMFIRTVVET